MSILSLTGLAAVVAGGSALLPVVGPWGRGTASVDRARGSPHRPGPGRAVPSSAAATPPGRPVTAGALLALVGVALAVGPFAAATLAVAAGTGRWLSVRRRRVATRRRIEATLPDLIDLFVVAASAGHPVAAALELVAARAPSPTAEPLADAVARLVHGATLDDTLAGLGAALGPPAAPLVQALRDGARDGGPLTERLGVVAATARDVRRRDAEARARRVPVQMLFPLVCCTLPAVGLLAVVPLLVASLSSLSP